MRSDAGYAYTLKNLIYLIKKRDGYLVYLY